jgi:predicted TIM-barrel fold metal-dependent hydrolase
MDKIWANSGDSHVMEPKDIWTSRLPEGLAERAPRAVKDERHETIYVDGQTVFRTLNQFSEAARAPGSDDPRLRLHDLDDEGVVNQVLFPSAGLWVYRMRDRELWAACARAYNDWMMEEVMSVSPRLVGVAMLPLVSTEDAIAELQRAADLGFRAAMLGTTPPEGRDYNLELWDPFWDAAVEAGLVLAFHVGTGADPRMFKGPGAVVINYVETFVPGQRTVSLLAASGALDRRPSLKVFIAEGGASWVPALADRMDEGYRQHGAFATPKLSRLPGEIIYEQVFASFQHDASAVPAFEAMRYPNVLWGDDYPHLEGTYGHTQDTLQHLFGSVDETTRQHLLVGNFDRMLGTTTRLPEAVPA